MNTMTIVWAVIKILIMVMFVLNLAAILTWADRRQSSMIQDRIGPNRAVVKIFGKEFRLAGLLHPLADGLKFFTKEDFMPPKADRLLFMLAPIMAMGMVFTLVATIPFGDTVCLHAGAAGTGGAIYSARLVCDVGPAGDVLSAKLMSDSVT